MSASASWLRVDRVIDFSLTEEQQTMREEIIRFAQNELSPGAAERDADGAFSRELWEKCGEMGFQGLPVPEEYGGSGLDAVTTAIALEALGYGCEDSGLVFSICAHLLSCVVPISTYGSEEQKRKYLPGLVSGKLIAVNGMSEPDSGSDAFAMSTKAFADGDGYRITGRKTFASNGPVGDMALLFARTGEKGTLGGLTAFLVDSGLDGFEQTSPMPKMGLRSSLIGDLVFDDVYLPAEAVIGGVGGGGRLFIHSMDWERTCLFASHVGTMERLLESAIKQARTREQFGQLIGKFQGVAHRIADGKVRLEAARLLAYRAAWALDNSRAPSLEASIAKLFISEALVETSLDALQTYGGYGYMKEYDLERGVRDALGSRLYSGTSDMQRNTIARWLGL